MKRARRLHITTRIRQRSQRHRLASEGGVQSPCHCTPPPAKHHQPHPQHRRRDTSEDEITRHSTRAALPVQTTIYLVRKPTHPLVQHMHFTTSAQVQRMNNTTQNEKGCALVHTHHLSVEPPTSICLVRSVPPITLAPALIASASRKRLSGEETTVSLFERRTRGPVTVR